VRRRTPLHARVLACCWRGSATQRPASLRHTQTRIRTHARNAYADTNADTPTRAHERALWQGRGKEEGARDERERTHQREEQTKAAGANRGRDDGWDSSQISRGKSKGMQFRLLPHPVLRDAKRAIAQRTRKMASRIAFNCVHHHCCTRDGIRWSRKCRKGRRSRSSSPPRTYRELTRKVPESTKKRPTGKSCSCANADARPCARVPAHTHARARAHTRARVDARTRTHTGWHGSARPQSVRSGPLSSEKGADRCTAVFFSATRTAAMIEHHSCGEIRRFLKNGEGRRFLKNGEIRRFLKDGEGRRRVRVARGGDVVRSRGEREREKSSNVRKSESKQASKCVCVVCLCV